MSIPVGDALMVMSALTVLAAGYVITSSVARGVCNRIRRAPDRRKHSVTASCNSIDTPTLTCGNSVSVRKETPHARTG